MSDIRVRCELLQGGSSSMRFAIFPNAEQATDHGMLCRMFALDPFRTSFDLPSTARGVGSASGLTSRSGRRIIDGIIFWHTSPTDKTPIGKLTFARPDERFPDVEPFNARDFYRLGDTVR